eukprot:1093788-Pelagomonas_calceolata.AAC.2
MRPRSKRIVSQRRKQGKKDVAIALATRNACCKQRARSTAQPSQVRISLCALGAAGTALLNYRSSNFPADTKEKKICDYASQKAASLE